MQDLAIAGIYRYMGYVLAVGPASAGEEHQIADTQIGFADRFTHFRLGYGRTGQIHTIFLKIN